MCIRDRVDNVFSPNVDSGSLEGSVDITGEGGQLSGLAVHVKRDVLLC